MLVTEGKSELFGRPVQLPLSLAMLDFLYHTPTGNLTSELAVEAYLLKQIARD